MKKIILCSLLLVQASVTIGQQSDTSVTLTKEDYLSKSRKYKKTENILLGIGGGLLLTGVVASFIDVGQMFNDSEDDDGSLAGLF